MPDEETQHQYYIHRSIPFSFSSWNYSSLLYETELTTSTNKKIKKSDEIENSKNEIHFSCIRYVRERERENLDGYGSRSERHWCGGEWRFDEKAL